MQEGEQQCLCCSAGGAVLGDRARARETLTAWRRLSSFWRSLSDGRRVTRALLAPSGGLCSGKGQGESWGSPKAPLLSCQAALPESCPQPRGPLSPGGELRSPGRLRPQHPPALPQQRAHPQLLQRPGAAEREEKQRQAPLPPSPWAEAGACTALPRGEGHGGRTKPRRAGQRCLPSPGSRRPARAAAFALPFWGPRGDPGMQDVQVPPSLPAAVLPAPCPGSARRAEPVPSTAGARLGSPPARPWHGAPRLTQKWQCRSPWAS